VGRADNLRVPAATAVAIAESSCIVNNKDGLATEAQSAQRNALAERRERLFRSYSIGIPIFLSCLCAICGHDPFFLRISRWRHCLPAASGAESDAAVPALLNRTNRISCRAKD